MLKCFKKLLIFTRIRSLNLGVSFQKLHTIISIIVTDEEKIINLIAILSLREHFKMKSLYHLQYNFNN